MAAKGIFLFNFLCICMRSYSSLVETDTITQGQQLLDYQHLVSAGGIFKLGFFSPRNSKHRYLGIWYKEDRDETVVWVANRNIPIMDTRGVLTIDGNGNLKIVRGEETLIVLNSNKATTNSTATLEDNGNFIMREVNSKQVLWQSFDYPTNTLLPGMKLGVNFKTGHRWSLVSWLSSEVPASGAFTLGGDPNGTSQLFMWQRRDLYWTSGVWSNGSFEFLRMYRYLLEAHERFQMQYISEEDEKYITYSVKDGSNSMWVMELSGKIMDHQQQIGTSAVCDGYSSDGGCLGPKLPECRSQYTFRKEIGGMYGQPEIWGNLSLGLSDCYAECMSNCSCVAYGSRYRNGTGCMFWSRGSSFEGFTAGNEVYVDKGIGSMSGKAGAKILEGKYWWIWFCFAIAVALVILLLDSLYRSRRKLRIEVEKDANELVMLFSELETNVTTFDNLTGANEVNKDGKGHDLKVFSFACIMAATNNFANENKLGEGGFGPVYKGKLHEGWEIAVKRLSRSSGQGLIEFKNEIILISKLQHMNLVKLFGCCFQGEEKMLIYEFMPNKSLDFFLFDPSKREHLNWKKRFNIIEGIAQGLLYLHKYSRLRIIHRDLKASNILLDDDMNPKISDFGMARIFGRNASEAITNRIVGTYGYMSPEYAMEGIFSVKSDVFSFGVLLLEIVSGRKNNSFYDPHHPLTIIGYTWEMWKEGTILELMDPTLGASCPKHEVLRCIHVGLLCVQENAIDRPNMSNVASMLSNETIPLPPPKQPAFFTGRSIIEADLSKAKAEKYSINGLSISVLEAR